MKKKFNKNANKGGVYQIKNLTNGKVYIGSAKCFKKRANQHQSQLTKQKHYNKFLQRSWEKEGTDNFIFEVLEVVDGDKLERTTKEKEYLDKIDDWTACYNFQKNPICQQGPWSKNPDETGKKMSENSKKRWQDPAFKEKHSKKMKDKWSDPKYKSRISQKVSKTTKDQWKNPESKQKLLEAIQEAAKERVGTSWGQHTAGHKEKMSEIMKGNSWNKGRKLPKNEREFHTKTLENQKKSPKRINNLRKKLCKPILAIDPENNHYHFDSFIEAQKISKISRITIRRNIQGKQKSRTGWKFSLE